MQKITLETRIINKAISLMTTTEKGILFEAILTNDREGCSPRVQTAFDFIMALQGEDNENI